MADTIRNASNLNLDPCSTQNHRTCLFTSTHFFHILALFQDYGWKGRTHKDKGVATYGEGS